ncbi:MAG: hypothetical protein HZB39_16865 [Planctomycetes bacterium]|nr:hypothetical protein [Planctomycetota bacterium]
MRIHLTLLACLCVAAGLSAQTRTVPAIADFNEGNDLTSYPFGRTAFRAQQLFESAYLAPNVSVLTAIEYRADNDNSSAKPAVLLNNVSFDLSETTITSGTMSTTYASNVTGPVTNVFASSVSLPAYASTSGGIAPWGILIPFNVPFTLTTANGNLLVDATATGANASSGYTLDSALPGGATRFLGQSGPTVNPLDRLQLLVSANGPTQGRYSGLIPGGSVIVFAQASLTAYSGAMWFGLTKYPTPIDLTFVGAPNNYVYVDNLIDQAFTMTGGIAYRAMITLPIPNVTGILGVSAYSQAVVASPAANALGFVTTNGLELTIGEAGNHPLRMVRGTDPLAVTGSFNYTSGILGGPVVRFSGTFF